VIARLNEHLFRELAGPGIDAVAVYDRYLATRNAGYMEIESGGRREAAMHSATGYDKIALSVVRAIHFNSGSVIPLNVRNDGNLPLEPDDCVEVPCVVNANGALPMHVPALPPRIAEFIQRVKRYERLAIEAAHAQTPQAAVEALAANPLVADRVLAHTLYDALAPLW
jgi:6-phospho-beta-glucosidase